MLLVTTQSQAMKLTAGSIEGKKMQKERITLGLCVNATGTDKMKPLIINKALRPRAFGKTWHVSDFVDWFANSSAWMNARVRL